MTRTPDYRLYLVTDRDILKNGDLCTAIEAAIQGGVTLVQLREKTASSRDFFEVAVKVKIITDKHNVPLIINDRLDIALAVDAAGLHIGQDDLPLAVARRLLGPDKVIGVSTATVEEALAAEQAGADYLGVGAIFPTATKDDADSVSLAELRTIQERVAIPVVAIGGIGEGNASHCMSQGIAGVSVVSAILGKDDIREAAAVLRQIIDSSMISK